MALMSSCTFINVLDDGHGLCRSSLGNKMESLQADADYELERGSPRGYASQPYSREIWDAFWNNMVYYNWKIGPNSCGGTYDGRPGPEIVIDLVSYRRTLGLPEINWDERNDNKGL